MKPLLQLLRSMRFAVAILCVVALAATIGSVLEQSQPAAVYVGNYGELWAALFALTGLTDVYHAWWFFLLLGAMAASTGLCLLQHAPQMLHEMRSYRADKSVASLRRLPEHAELARPAVLHPGLVAPLARYLRAQGFRSVVRTGAAGTLVAARTGAARRLGYLLVHAAIVLVCVGGLIDGNVALRWRLWTGAARLETRALDAGEVPAHSRLPAGSGSFRATMNLAEGATGDTALLNLGDGYLAQQLPFKVRLKRFRVEHYAGSARPSDFASDIEIVDGARVVPATLHVNHPFSYRGVSLYQSGFADGGSTVGLRLWQAGSSAPVAQLDAKVGSSAALLLAGQPVTLELDEWRANNVFAQEQGGAGWFAARAPGSAQRDLGPSLAFRLRDGSGQAEDWLVYRNPIEIDGRRFLVQGRQRARDDAMRFLRVPLDADGRPDGFMRLSHALADGAARSRAATALAAGAGDKAVRATLEKTAAVLLQAFARGGYRALAALVAGSVPAPDQLQAGRLYAGLLERAAMLMVPGAAPGLVHASLAAYSERLEGGFDTLFQVGAVTEVRASSLQLTRAPGAALVYLGAALLALGVCAMCFVRERRLWFWLDAERGTLLLAYAGNRASPMLRQEFERHRGAVAALLPDLPDK